MKHRTPESGSVIFLLSISLLIFASPLAGQSAQQILDRALERYRSQTRGIDDYTVVQTVMGFETTTYYERQTVDGESVLVPQSSMGSEAGRQVPQNPQRLYAQLAERATLKGSERVRGEQCHVIVVTDFSGTDLQRMGPGGEQAGWNPERMRLFVDSDDYLLRRIVGEGTVESTGERQAATFTVDLEDYRQVDGLVHPFRMRIATEGFGEQMSADERAELQQSLEKMRQQMADMPPQQRKMVEKLMGGQLEKLEKMLVSGTLDFTVEVQEIRVNEGPPQGN